MIKKFLNPSGKLTYEEALRQAGERVESLKKASVLVKGVNNSNKRARIRNHEKPNVVITRNKKSKKVYNPDNGVIAKAKRKALNAIGISNSDIKRMQSDLVELGILPDGGSNGTNYGVVMPGILDGAPNIKITKVNASKITPKQWTIAQDAAIARGDMAEAQRLRDLHNSLTPTATSGKYYRGTETKRNSYPDRHIDEEVGEMNGIYLTKKPKYAKTYGDVEEFYLRSNNPLETEGSWTGVIDNATRAEIENAGYDAVVNNRFDTGFLNKLLRNSRDETIVFDGRNLKLADAVTYDDNGVRIPLGERDNFNINDIRYGLLPFGIGLTGYGLYNLFNQPLQRLLYYKQGGKMNTILFLQKGNGIFQQKLGQLKKTLASTLRERQQEQANRLNSSNYSGRFVGLINEEFFGKPMSEDEKNNITIKNSSKNSLKDSKNYYGSQEYANRLRSAGVNMSNASRLLNKLNTVNTYSIGENTARRLNKIGNGKDLSSTFRAMTIYKPVVVDGKRYDPGVYYNRGLMHNGLGEGVYGTFVHEYSHWADKALTPDATAYNHSLIKLNPNLNEKEKQYYGNDSEIRARAMDILMNYNHNKSKYKNLNDFLRKEGSMKGVIELRKTFKDENSFQNYMNHFVLNDNSGMNLDGIYYSKKGNKIYINAANARKWNHKKGGVIVAGDGIKLGNSTNNSLETRNVSDHNLGRLYDELSKSKIPMNHTTREQFITRSKDVINAINKHFSGPEIPRVFRNALLTVALEETGLNPSNLYLYGIIGGLRNLYLQKFGGRKDSDSITHFIKNYFKGEYKNLGYSPKAIPSNITDPREILTYYMTNLGDPSFFKRKNKGNTVAWKKWNEWLPIILNSNLIALNDSNFGDNKNLFNTFSNESENNLNNVFNNSSENDSYNIVDPANLLEKLNKQSGNIMLSKNGSKITIYKFKKGNKIHIKKANRGKFTDYCGGKVTNECILRGKNSSDPAVRKRATFAANARKWNHKKGGIIIAEGGIKLGDIFSKAQGFLNSDTGKLVKDLAGKLYSGIKESNNLRKQEEQLLKDYNYISKQINTLDVINKTNQLFQELQLQDPNIHVSEIDWRNLYGKNEGIAKQLAQANARNYLVNARQLMMLLNPQSSGGGLDFSGLINAGALLLAGNKNKTNTGTTNTTTTNTQIPSTATPTYFSSSFDWSKPTLTSAIKFNT